MAEEEAKEVSPQTNENATTQEAAAPEDDDDDEEEIQPTTALVVLGNAMFFQPEGDVLAVTILSKTALPGALSHANPDSLEDIHIIVKGSELSEMYDEDALTKFRPLLKAEGKVTFHVLQNPSPEQMDTIKMSLVMAQFKILAEQDGPDGSMIMVGQKAGE